MELRSSQSKRIPEIVVQDAINQTEFGKFNWMIFTVCAIVVANEGLLLGNVGIIIPSAACDYDMSTMDKSLLSMTTLFGMIFGPYCWAAIAEVRGRKVGLITSLIFHTLGELISAFVTTYWGLLVGKTIVGFGLSGFVIVYTYLAEFQPCKYRDRLVCWLEVAWVCGFFLSAALGWFIIPLTFNYQLPAISFFFKSWNLYILICAILPLITVICLLLLPETPKYLAEVGKHSEMLSLLQDIYHLNTGNPREIYIENLKYLQNIGIDGLIIKGQKPNIRRRKLLAKLLKQYLRQTVKLFQRPYLRTTLLIILICCTVTTPYYIMLFWLPEIFKRFSEYQESFPGESGGVCTVSDVLYSANASQTLNVNRTECTGLVDESVFHNSMFVAAACMPVAIIVAMFIDKFGYKWHLIGASLCGAVVVYCLLLVKNPTQNLIVSCLFESFASICIMIVQCMTVEIYPTHIRVIASAFTQFIGGVGSVIGISTVGYLIDNYCESLIIFIGANLIVVCVVAIFVPVRKSREEFEKRERARREIN